MMDGKWRIDGIAGAFACCFMLSDRLGAQPVPLNPQGAYFDARCGRVCAGVGDLDGDGYGDVLAGVPGEYVNWPPSPPSSTGAGYLYSGRTGKVLLRIVSPRQVRGGEFGYAVATLPDINGDESWDLIIGAYLEGAADCFSGADGNLLYTLRASNPLSRGFGKAVCALADISGDSIHDIAVGATFESGGARTRLRLFWGHGNRTLQHRPSRPAVRSQLWVQSCGGSRRGW